MKLGNVKIGTRLGFGFGAILLLLMVVGFLGYRGVKSISTTTLEILNSDARIAEHAARARSNVLGLRRYEKDLYLNIGSKEKEEEYLKKWKEQAEHLSARLGDLEKVVELEKDKSLVASMKNELSAYESGFNNVYKMITDGQIKTPQEANKAIGEYKSVIHKMEQDAKDFADEGNKRMNAAKPLIEATTNRTALTMPILVLIAAILSIGIGIPITRSITSPLYKAVEVSNSLADGDLTVEMGINSNDETGQLLASMKKMTDSLRYIMDGISQASNQIASASEELSATVEQTSKGMQRQTSQTSQIASAMEELSATVIEVAKNASGASESAKESNKIAQKGKTTVERTVEGMNGIAQSVEESASVITQLGTRSNEIGEIIKVIDDIADQTNLLALNAAIEAARAGEHGRGFAVVADEVRKLAEKTTKATKEIGGMISTIQDETGKAVTSMGEVTKEVNEEVKQAKDAGEALNEIAANVDKLTGLIQQIAVASEEQSAATDTISKDIQDIATTTKETSTSSTQIADASNDLAKLATDLQGMLSKFKVRSA